MAKSSGEPFGTTPLPTSGKVSFDWESLGDVAQQPQSQQIAVYEATPNEKCINGCLLDVNQHFVVYAVKNGLIRVLHRHSALRSLLRGHQGQLVTDIQFFQEGDVLATAGHSDTESKIIIWRVYEQSPDIRGDILLEIPSTSIQMDRIIWHPFNPNQFLMVHSTQGHAVSTLVETTRLQTSPHPETGHAVVQFHSPSTIMDGAVQLSCAQSSLTDVCWSGRDSRHVLTVHEKGEIILWDLKQHDVGSSEEVPTGVTRPKLLAKIETGESQSRCFFLPHENTVDFQTQTDNLTTCFGTASEMNSVVTIWSAFTASKAPTKLQTISVQQPSPSYVIDICFGPAPQDASPPSCFLLMGDRHAGKLLAFHVQSVWSNTPQKKALLQGCDYVVPFQHKHPIYSWSVVCSPTTDISEEDLQEQAGLIFDMKLFSYQAKVVQCLTVTSFMCLPPEHSYTGPIPGVLHEPFSAKNTLSDGIASVESYDEDYDIEEEEPVEDEYQAPDAATLPTPTGIAGNTSNNPFANWLGAIAGTPQGAVPLPTPEEQESAVSSVVQSNSGTSTPTSQQFLSPTDLLKSQQDTKPETKSSKVTQKSKKSRSKSPKAKKGSKQEPNMPTGKIQILKREENPTLSAPEADQAFTPSPVQSKVGPGVATSNSELERIISKALAAHQEQQQAALVGQVQLAVAEEMSKLLPSLTKVVQDTVSATVRPLANSIDQLSKKGVQVNKQQFAEAVEKSLEEPLQLSMAKNMKNVFIPAFESVSSQVLQQVNASMPQPSAAEGAKLDALTAQLAAMSGTMQQMMKSIDDLKSKSSVAHPSAQAHGGQIPPPPPHQPQVESIRNEVNALLAQNQYEAAFTKALSAGTPDMTVYCCSKVNVADVLGGSKPALSQPILLCLMQQLGATLLTSQSSNLQMEVSWLQELALTLNPTDPSIQRHAPTVLQQIVTSINQRMTKGDPQLRRPLHMLLQVIRGMQMG